MFSRYRFKDGFTRILGNPGYAKINYLGEIKTKQGDDFKTFLDNEGHPSVTLDAWDGYRDYRIIELVLFQYKDIHVQIDRWDEIIPFVIDGVKTNVQAKNVGYRFKNGPIETRKYSGLYYIPGFTKYAISKDGYIHNSKSGNRLRYQVTRKLGERNIKGGYYTLNVSTPNGKPSGLSRHRAMALTFLEYPDNVDNMVVNHIDGIPGNDTLDNLEWVTRGQNNTHAYENDLKNQHKRVIVRDVRTGKDTEYYSISETARQMGFAVDEAIRFRLYKCEFGYVFHDGTQIKLKDDPRPFPVVKDIEKAISEGWSKRPVKVRNCLTLKVLEFDSTVAAGKYTEVNHGTIKWRLDRDDNSPLFGYQFKYLEDESDWPDFTMEEYRQSLIPNSFGIDARNLLTGEEMSFKSIAATRRHFKGDIATILRRGDQYFRWDGWQIKLSKDEWVHVEDPESYFSSIEKGKGEGRS